jgi:hypothetical protein
MPKQLGSLIFNTTEIRSDEYVLMAKAMKENNVPISEIPLHIEAIDDMLCIQKVSSIINSRRFTKTGRLRKDISLSSFIENRIEKLMNDLKTSDLINPITQ